MKEKLLQEAYDKFRLSLGQEPQPMSPKAMEYFCEAMDKIKQYCCKCQKTICKLNK